MTLWMIVTLDHRVMIILLLSDNLRLQEELTIVVGWWIDQCFQLIITITTKATTLSKKCLIQVDTFGELSFQLMKEREK